MSKPTTTSEDNLAHLSSENDAIDANDSNALFNQVSATSGSITIISGFGCSIVLNWSFSSTSVSVGVQLQTPVGSINLINANLNAQQPCIDFGGGLGGFKAQGQVCFDFSTMELTASGQVCAPFVGCKSGSVSVHV